jgi:hypothetical protein
MAAGIPRLVLGRVNACVMSLIEHHPVSSGMRRRSRRELSRKRSATECRKGGYCYNQPFHANSPFGRRVGYVHPLLIVGAWEIHVDRTILKYMKNSSSAPRGGRCGLPLR